MSNVSNFVQEGCYKNTSISLLCFAVSSNILLWTPNVWCRWNFHPPNFVCVLCNNFVIHIFVPGVFCDKLVLLLRMVISLGQQLHNGIAVEKNVIYLHVIFLHNNTTCKRSEFKMYEKINSRYLLQRNEGIPALALPIWLTVSVFTFKLW